MAHGKNEFVRKWLDQTYEQPDISIEFQVRELYCRERDEMPRTGISISMETLKSIDSQDDDDTFNLISYIGTDDIPAWKDLQDNMLHTIQQGTGKVGVEDANATQLNGPTIFAPLPQQQMIRLEECTVAEKVDEDGYDFPVSKVSAAELIETLPKDVRAKLPRILMRYKVFRGNKTGPPIK